MQAFHSLRRILSEAPGRLEQLPDPGRKPASGKWSAKEELGHLLDSAVNNHQRIVRAQVQSGLSLPGYQQENWVRIHAYQQRDWHELIQLWTALNRHLLVAAEAVPASAWGHCCTVDGEPSSLQFVFEDYLRHMLHHLQHIGVEVADLQETGVRN
jgi:hypothetical protein